VGIEKILCAVIDEAHKRQVEETTETLSEEPKNSTDKRLSFRRNPFPYRGGIFLSC
jgi:hypothetical protein